MSQPIPRRSRSRFLIGGVVVFAICAVGIRLYETHSLSRIEHACALDGDSQVRTAEVLRAVRSLKIITCEIDTQVRVDRGDENWRGVVRASVTTPVRMRYGVDLEQLDATTIAYSSISESRSGLIVLRVSYPELLATEVFSAQETIDVSTEGLRLRNIGGEYYLGLARRDVPDAARQMKLRPADEAKVRAITADQIKALVSKIIGDDVAVIVRFIGEPT